MSTDTDDRLESRVAGLEATTDQLDTRLGRVESEIQALRGRWPTSARKCGTTMRTYAER
jgi:hypothetical protein